MKFTYARLCQSMSANKGKEIAQSEFPLTASCFLLSFCQDGFAQAEHLIMFSRPSRRVSHSQPLLAEATTERVVGVCRHLPCEPKRTLKALSPVPFLCNRKLREDTATLVPALVSAIKVCRAPQLATTRYDQSDCRQTFGIFRDSEPRRKSRGVPTLSRASRTSASASNQLSSPTEPPTREPVIRRSQRERELVSRAFNPERKRQRADRRVVKPRSLNFLFEETLRPLLQRFLPDQRSLFSSDSRDRYQPIDAQRRVI
ncbi:uncharacterized protein LOC143210061 [Lasioglossum baleicum]|uniref:uncharacterized protein LOC143210061 n=1 Tax=Lasioglossum baleicum TaxID=434251 RepID=UPI003FCDF10C